MEIVNLKYMLSTYARKQMLKFVAAQFNEEQVEWLAQQAEFNTACDTLDNRAEIIELGKHLLKGRKPVHKHGFTNTIEIPPLDTGKSS